MIFDLYKMMELLDGLIETVLHNNRYDKTPYCSKIKNWMIVFELLKIPIIKN